jgi:hypothetical protein
MITPEVVGSAADLLAASSLVCSPTPMVSQ